MDGLECSEILFSQIDLGDRFDSDYYTKNYLHISDQMSKVPTEKLGKLATTVASAFYPAATQLYSEGDTAFARCVDCVSYPVITKDQDSKFEKIPYAYELIQQRPLNYFQYHFDVNLTPQRDLSASEKEWFRKLHESRRQNSVLWFLDFVYRLRNALFHEIIDPLDEEWQVIFKNAYLVLKEIVDLNIAAIETR